MELEGLGKELEGLGKVFEALWGTVLTLCWWYRGVSKRGDREVPAR
jgi:hypothetical protein